jgi:hypothetical protein
VGALGGHKGRPYGIFIAGAKIRGTSAWLGAFLRIGSGGAVLRACDFFKFDQKAALTTKELTARRSPKIEKSHKL